MDLSNVTYVERDGVKYDVVEIALGGFEWKRRICIWKDNTSCATVDEGREEDFLEKKYFPVCLWQRQEWRHPPQKKYIPFTIEDAPLFRDRWVVKKSNSKMVLRIDVYNHDGIWTHNEYIPFSDALNECFFDDGTPFGKEVLE